MGDPARAVMMFNHGDTVADMRLVGFERDDFDMAAVVEFDTDIDAIAIPGLGDEWIDAIDDSGELGVLDSEIQILIGNEGANHCYSEQAKARFLGALKPNGPLQPFACFVAHVVLPHAALALLSTSRTMSAMMSFSWKSLGV